MSIHLGIFLEFVCFLIILDELVIDFIMLHSLQIKIVFVKVWVAFGKKSGQ